MHFSIKALDARQQVVALTLEAADRATAVEAAKNKGLKVLSVERKGFALSALRGRAPGFPTALFSIELMALLDAGLNLVEALQTLTDKETHAGRQVVLSGMLAALFRGESFSQAVSHFPQHFSPLYVATLRASERTGDVRESLTRYISYQEELDRVRKKVISATVYPIILTVVGTLVIAFLMLYVVPRFARVYEDVSGTLPFFSSMLLAVGRGIESNGVAIAIFAGCAAVFVGYSLTQASFRAWLWGRVWRIPGLGERMKVYQLARLYRTVGMLLRAGIPAVRSLDMVRDLLAPHLRPYLTRARALVEEGQSMSYALSAMGLATPVAARMMSVGERGGNMGEMMGRIARFHDEETSRFIDVFMRAFEPILMAVLGIAVGGVVVLMYMPIFELAGSIE